MLTSNFAKMCVETPVVDHKLYDSSDGSLHLDEEDNHDHVPFSTYPLSVRDYVLVKFQLKKSTHCNVGLVQGIAEGVATIIFVPKKAKTLSSQGWEMLQAWVYLIFFKVCQNLYSVERPIECFKAFSLNLISHPSCISLILLNLHFKKSVQLYSK